MIPEWIDLRSAILGAVVAYSIPILFAVLWCWLCDYADRCACKRRDWEEQRRINLHVTRKRTEINADCVVAWADNAPHTDVVEHQYHHIEIRDNDDG